MDLSRVPLLTLILGFLLLALTGCNGATDEESDSGSGDETTYRVTYEGNGNSAGSVPLDNNSYQAAQYVTVQGNPGGLSRNGYLFVGWNTRADGNGSHYIQDNQFAMPESDMLLYAQWSVNPANSNVPEPLSFELVDTGDYGLSFQTITQGTQIELATLPATFNFTVEFAANPGSVKVDLVCNASSLVDRYENNPIYTVAPQSGSSGLTPADLSTGSCTLSATPYELADLKGEQGATLTVGFIVSGTDDNTSGDQDSSDCDGTPDQGTETRVRYLDLTVDSGSTCVSETQSRICNNGSWGEWSGDYTFPNCTVSTESTTPVPYQIPSIPTADDFSNTVYIDPSSATNGDGSIESPHNTLENLAIAPDTAYLIKAGTTLNERITKTWNNNYVGMYGEGERPILTASFTVLSLDNNSQDVTFEHLHFTTPGTGNYTQVIRLPNGCGNPGLVIANCKITGKDTGSGYPTYNIKGSSAKAILYHNEFSYSGNDGIYGGCWEDSQIVSNWFHHNNMNGLTSTTSTGDSFQMESASASNVYIANNYMDRSHTIWKFTLIINSLLSLSENVVAEWNTFVAPRTGAGGAAVRWLAGTNNTFRKNLLNTETGIPGIAGYDEHANQPAPYGIRDNHKVGAGDFCALNLTLDDPTNLEFQNFDEYTTYLSDNGITSYGSDLDLDNYWNQ